MLTHALREPLSRMSWGNQAFTPPAPGDLETWSVDTDIEQDAIENMARDAVQVLALAVIASKARPEWIFTVTEDVSFLVDQVGGPIKLRGGQTTDGSLQAQLDSMVKPLLDIPTRKRRRAVMDVSEKSGGWSIVQQRETQVQATATVDLPESEDDTATRLGAIEVRQLETGKDGTTFLVDATVLIGNQPVERVDLRILLLDGNDAPMGSIELSHGRVGVELEADSELEIADHQVTGIVSGDAKVAGMRVWMAVVRPLNLPVLHTWWWRGEEGGSPSWHVGVEVEAAAAHARVDFQADWYDRNGRNLRTERFGRALNAGRQLVYSSAPMHTTMARAEGPVRVRAIASATEWTRCDADA